MPSAAALRSSARRPGTVSVPSRGTPTESGPALEMLALLGREKGMRISHGKRDSARAKAREENEEGRGNSDGRAQTLQLFHRATHSSSSTKQTQKERREERASRVLLRQLEALGDLRWLFSLLSPQLAFELKGAPPASFIWSSKAFPHGTKNSFLVCQLRGARGKVAARGLFLSTKQSIALFDEPAHQFHRRRHPCSHFERAPRSAMKCLDFPKMSPFLH